MTKGENAAPTPTDPEARRSAGRAGGGVGGVLVGLAWVGGAALGYYLLCALGFGLYRLLQWAF